MKKLLITSPCGLKLHHPGLYVEMSKSEYCHINANTQLTLLTDPKIINNHYKVIISGYININDGVLLN